MNVSRSMTLTVRRQYGLTLTEVLIAIVLLTILLAPAMQALHTGSVGVTVHSNQSINHYRLVARLETVLADSYSSLEGAAAGDTVPSVYSDPIGTIDRILVYISPYDIDNADADNDPFSGTDDGVLSVRVALEDSVQELASLALR